jgi:hypothetical protein
MIRTNYVLYPLLKTFVAPEEKKMKKNISAEYGKHICISAEDLLKYIRICHESNSFLLV